MWCADARELSMAPCCLSVAGKKRLEWETLETLKSGPAFLWASRDLELEWEEFSLVITSRLEILVAFLEWMLSGQTLICFTRIGPVVSPSGLDNPAVARLEINRDPKEGAPFHSEGLSGHVLQSLWAKAPLASFPLSFLYREWLCVQNTVICTNRE